MVTTEQKFTLLAEWGIHVRERDLRLNTLYPGILMVVEGSPEEIESDYVLPTEDGLNGPWCVVGDDRQTLIDTGYDYLASLDAPGFAARLRELTCG